MIRNKYIKIVGIITVSILLLSLNGCAIMVYHVWKEHQQHNAKTDTVAVDTVDNAFDPGLNKEGSQIISAQK